MEDSGKIPERASRTREKHMRKIASEVMRKASEAMEQATGEMVMQRQILYEQYGLISFGSIMTFRHLQLIVAKDSALPEYRWGRAKSSMTHD